MSSHAKFSTLLRELFTGLIEVLNDKLLRVEIGGARKQS